MHIRIAFSSNYYKHINSSDNPKYTYLDRTFKEEQSDINFKLK